MTKPTIFALFLCAGLLLMSGCAGLQHQVNPTDHYLSLSGEQINREIVSLEESLARKDGTQGEAVKPATAYYLALLYSHQNNPLPDYARAADLLDEYIAQLPHGPEKYRLLHTLDLLYTINSFKLVETECQQVEEEKGTLAADKKFLEADNQSLKKKCAELKRNFERITKENKKMRNSIEQLKMLDLRLEEKKRAIQ
ncbi:MAG: hypothetical protein V1706_00645 [Pseudomonadota bacterium]